MGLCFVLDLYHSDLGKRLMSAGGENLQEQEQSHVTLLTSFKYFEWKAEMVVLLRSRGLYRVTMGTENELSSVVKKYKYFNKLDEAFRMFCLSILRDLLFHVDNITTPNEVWLKLESLFGKTDNMRGHQLENELMTLSPT